MTARKSGLGGRTGRPREPSGGLVRIVSGGQTGADRAALNWAIARGISHGGWCPKGRKAEDGPIPRRYQLMETPSASYLQRTELNVRDSDGTVILSLAETLTGGSRRTAELARQYGKPWLHLAKSAGGRDAGALLRRFLRQHDIHVLNVAGPRASTEPEVGEFVTSVLERAFPRPSGAAAFRVAQTSRAPDGEARSRTPSPRSANPPRASSRS